jgi:hypothetical protein
MKARLDLHHIYNRRGDIGRLGSIRRMPFTHRGLPDRASLSSKEAP